MSQDVAPVQLRATLAAMPAYLPGKPAQAVAGRPTYKLSSNENPYPPLPSVQAVVERLAGSVNRYPDMFATGLVEAIGEHLGVPAECITTGTGSVGVLSQIVAATCGDGDEMVFGWRSFEAYPIVALTAGAVPVPVPLTTDGRHDLPAMAAAVTGRTRLVLVCTPNNPTGTTVRQADLEEFLDAVPRDVAVVIDEAYVEFVRDAEAPDALGLQRSRPNVIVLRTFSKAYGLAGLRVGFAVAHPVVATALRQTAVPFGVSTVAQEAAVASLRAGSELAERVDALVAERRRLAGALAGQGWQLPPSEANFIWFPLGARTTAFALACEQAGLVVRPYGTDGVRVTVGETAANDLLLEVAGRFLAADASG